MSDAVFSIQNLSIRLAKTEILRSVSLDIPDGSCTVILGPNGAGKTTLVKCLNRLLSPQSGSVYLHGKSLKSYSQKDIAKHVAYVPQANNSFFSFTVYEFVMLGRYPHMSPFTAVSSEGKAVVDEALEHTGMSDFKDRSMSTLSGGERQAVFIAAALVQGGNVLLMDEPTTYLDYKHQVDVLDLIRKLHAERNMTIVLVTHDVNQALSVCDHVVALNDGRKKFDGTPDQLLMNDQLETIFDTPFVRTEVDGQQLPMVTPVGGAR
jgi:iron complex transport system ATP-binding protein